MKTIVQFALRSYKRLVSPMFLPSCKYTPTCSEYAMDAVEYYGVVRGLCMAAWRILRCNPFSKGGLDPVVRPASETPVIGPQIEIEEHVCRSGDKSNPEQLCSIHTH